jgi:hypothetical protein
MVTLCKHSSLLGFFYCYVDCNKITVHTSIWQHCNSSTASESIIVSTLYLYNWWQCLLKIFNSCLTRAPEGNIVPSELKSLQLVAILIKILKTLKGQCHEIFDLRFFHQTIPPPPWAPDSRAKAFLNSASNSPRFDRFSNAKSFMRCQ